MSASRLCLRSSCAQLVCFQDNVPDDQVAHHLRRAEMVSNVFNFLLAGYETTATALAYCTYVLATHPAHQEKLRMEIDKAEENAQRIDYMDLFIREVLRMHPIAPTAPSRVCSTETVVCGYAIEKGLSQGHSFPHDPFLFPYSGAVIQPDMFSVHYSKELWGPADPHEFVPERHLDERHRMAYFAFGQGPRNCVGMRFALMELRLCLTELLRQYVILPGENLEERFQIHDAHLIRQPEAVMIKLQKRASETGDCL